METSSKKTTSNQQSVVNPTHAQTQAGKQEVQVVLRQLSLNFFLKGNPGCAGYSGVPDTLIGQAMQIIMA